MKKFYGGLFLVLILAVGLVMPTNAVEAASKKVSLKISNGGTYYGEVKNGKPHGKGTAKWGGNKTYSGDWVNGKRSGKGKLVQKSGEEKTVYEGSWSNDQKNGIGVEKARYGPWGDEHYINKGTFKNNSFKTGYHINVGSRWTSASYSSDKEEIGFSYYTGDFTINPSSVMDITSMSYLNKSSGEGYSVTNDNSSSEYEKGQYKKIDGLYNLYNGTKLEISDGQTKIYEMKNGKKTLKSTTKNPSDGFDYEYVTAKLDPIARKIIAKYKPYSNEFVKLHREGFSFY